MDISWCREFYPNKIAGAFYLLYRGLQNPNYPFTTDDMDNLQLPVALKPYINKLLGLTISPERLAAIREELCEKIRYASSLCGNVESN